LGLALAPALAEDVGARVREALEAAGALERFALLRPDELHLTLVFLGSVERAGLVALEQQLAPALSRFEAPALGLAATGAFPAPGRERVLWVGVEERARARRLAACRSSALGALAAVGLADADAGQPFHPHVTVARARRRPRVSRGSGSAARPRPPEEFYGLAFAQAWNPSEVVLFESVPPGARDAAAPPEGGTGRYRALARFPFRSVLG